MDNKNLNDNLKNFISNEDVKETKQTPQEEVVIKNKQGLIEVKQLDKKIITEDGRQLLT